MGNTETTVPTKKQRRFDPCRLQTQITLCEGGVDEQISMKASMIETFIIPYPSPHCRPCGFSSLV